MSRHRFLLGAFLAPSALLVLGCAANKAAPPLPRFPAPTTVVAGEEDGKERARERWEEQIHRTRPGTSWRQIEHRNHLANLKLRSELVADKAAGVTGGVFWRERGSRNQTGRTRVTALAGDGRTLLVGTDHGGLFSGAIGGSEWTPRSDSLGIGIDRFVVVPGTPETWVTYWSGLFVSKDAGATWQGAGGDPCGASRGLLTDAARPRTVYSLTDAYSWNGPQLQRGYSLCRSRDGGITFRVIRFVAKGTASMWNDRNLGGALYLASNTDLLVSDDGGDSFHSRGTIPGPVEDLVLTGSEAGAPKLYLAVLHKDGDHVWDLDASADAGATFQLRSQFQDFWYSLTASRVDPNLVFVGGTQAYRSADGGATLTMINSWTDYYGDPEHKLHADIPGIDALMIGGREVWFFDTDGGTFWSEDGGLTVRNLTQHNLGDSQYYGLLTSVHDPNLIVAGAQDQGYQRSTTGPADQRLDFAQLISGDYGSLRSSNGTHDMLYSAYPGFILLQKTEAPPYGLELIQFPNDPGNGWIPPLAADLDDPNVVYFGGKKIWKMVRHAPNDYTSTAFAQSLLDPSASWDHIGAFAISPVDHNYWYAATASGGLWYSRDAGATWVKGGQVPYFYPNDVTPSPDDRYVCYVGGSGYNAPSGVYRTFDGGATWTPAGSGLPQTTVRGVAVVGPQHVAYAATESGPFRLDGDGRWRNLLGTEAPLTSYTDVEAVPGSDVVRFATYGRGIWDYSPTGGPCVPGDGTMCLQGGRFEVKVAWEDFQHNRGAGHVDPASGNESGLVWFFGPANWEVMVKVLDGCGLNGKLWVFAAATTNVGYQLQVRDTSTGVVRQYDNPVGTNAAAITDTAAFSCTGGSAAAASAAAAAPPAPPSAAPPTVLAGRSTAAKSTCATTDTTLCLGSRLALDMTWKDFQGGTGVGHVAPPRTPDSGIFWFFGAANWEALVKVVDGCSLNDHYWVFGAALTNVEYRLRVVDTISGVQKEYSNPLGRSSPAIIDTEAVPCH